MKRFLDEWMGLIVVVGFIVGVFAFVLWLSYSTRLHTGLFYEDYNNSGGHNLMATQMFELRADVHVLQTAIAEDRR